MNRPRARVALSLLLPLVASIGLAERDAAAETILVGGNIVNQTWTAQGSPYVIQGDVTVPPSAFLRIQAGTVVRFAASDHMGSGRDPNRVELTVRGALRVEGTADAPIALDGSSAAPGSWYGIDIASDATEARLRHVVVRHAAVGVEHHAAGVLDIAHARFRDIGGAGIHAEAGSLTADDIEVTAAGAGVSIGYDASASLSRCLLHHNSGMGIYSVGGPSETLSIRHCTIHKNGSSGLYLMGDDTIEVTSVIVSNNWIGLRARNATRYTITRSNFWGNHTNFDTNRLQLTGRTSAISANPLYVSDTDLRLTSNSPSRFGGVDGTDMGALPYDGAPTSGLLGTLWIDTTLGAEAHIVSGDLTIAPGVTLTVVPDATLRFGGGDSMAAGRDSRRTELIVRGTLRAEGTAERRVTFEGAYDSPTAWQGIQIEEGAGLAKIRHAALRHAYQAIAQRDPGSALDLAFATFDTCDTGLYVTRGTLTADAVEISRSHFGVHVEGSGVAALTNCLIHDNEGYGAVSYGVAGVTLRLAHCTIARNLTGVLAKGWTLATIDSSIITGNSTGIFTDTYEGVTTTYSNVWGNPINYVQSGAGTGTVSTNPLFVSNSDFHLQSGSPCIDAAGPGSSDHDIVDARRPADGDGINGAAPDMGAYELVPVPVCGDGIVNGAEACDDGNLSNGDGCSATCTIEPSCGPTPGATATESGAHVDPAAGAGAQAAPPDDVEAEAGGCQTGRGGAGGALVVILGAIAALRRRRRED